MKCLSKTRISNYIH